MPKKAPFKIGYSDDAVGDLKWFGKQKGPKIVRQIGNRLSHEADVRTKNRKPLNPPILDSAWELRCGQNNSVRVFYDVDARDREVTIQPGRTDHGAGESDAGKEAAGRPQASPKAQRSPRRDTGASKRTTAQIAGGGYGSSQKGLNRGQLCLDGGFAKYKAQLTTNVFIYLDHFNFWSC